MMIASSDAKMILLVIILSTIMGSAILMLIVVMGNEGERDRWKSVNLAWGGGDRELQGSKTKGGLLFIVMGRYRSVKPEILLVSFLSMHRVPKRSYSVAY